MAIAKNTICVWYDKDAEAAARFYAVTFPVILFPRRGWAFNRLECQVELNPGEPSKRRPLAHDIFPASSWETLANGLQMWRMRITSAEAVSMNLGFTAYHMPPGGQLYVYSPDYSQVLGPYTEADNEQHGQLWTPIVDGAEVVVEVSLPASEASQLQLELTSCQVETATEVADSSDQLRSELTRLRRIAAESAQADGALLLAVAK